MNVSFDNRIPCPKIFSLVIILNVYEVDARTAHGFCLPLVRCFGSCSNNSARLFVYQFNNLQQPPEFESGFGTGSGRQFLWNDVVWWDKGVWNYLQSDSGGYINRNREF